ncbi:MAG: carbohydrate binding domain-containing protein [Verrucomicrobiota bacterium]
MRVTFIISLWLVLATQAPAQTTLWFYSDSLVNGFQDWSWASRNLANTSPVHSGTKSISVTANYWEAFSTYHPPFNTTLYSNFTFWVHGGTIGGQRLQISARANNQDQPAFVWPQPISNSWQQIVVPLSALGAGNKTNCDRFYVQLRNDGTTNTFYLDDMQLTPAAVPALVKIAVNAGQSLRTVDPRFFGVNTAIWDGYFDSVSTSNLLQEMGCLTLRFPGGSLSDEYHWASGTTGTNTWQWVTSFGNFMHIATNAAAQVFITVNYGTGTPAEAAAWVRHANITNLCAFKYWEIGNENYGTWETDTNNLPHDPYTYAVRAKEFILQMKAADPTIKVGVVGVTGEDSFVNNSNHPATNPRTSVAHNGWTPVMLATLKGLGVTPDFLVHHVYPEYTFQESDPLLLQASGNWATDAVDLRQQIVDYFGSGGTNIELVCTENNSNSGSQGKQSTSLVNGLYFADSLGQIMQTEFNAFVWWDFRNGTDFSGSMDATLYGWRNYGDLGMVNGLDTRHPPFFAAKLIQHFARPGDSVLRANSDHLLLSTYAARRTNGSLSLLIITKSPTAIVNAQITLTNFVPWTNATVRSFGIPQDEAARTNASAAARDISITNFTLIGTNFNYTFPPYSLTLFTFAPAPVRLSPMAALGSEIVFQLQGQAPSRYAIQNSSNLTVWTSITTNTLITDTLNITNVIAPGSSQKFWRAVWLP